MSRWRGVICRRRSRLCRAAQNSAPDTSAYLMLVGIALQKYDESDSIAPPTPGHQGGAHDCVMPGRLGKRANLGGGNCRNRRWPVDRAAEKSWAGTSPSAPTSSAASNCSRETKPGRSRRSALRRRIENLSGADGAGGEGLPGHELDPVGAIDAASRPSKRSPISCASVLSVEYLVAAGKTDEGLAIGTRSSLSSPDLRLMWIRCGERAGVNACKLRGRMITWWFFFRRVRNARSGCERNGASLP